MWSSYKGKTSKSEQKKSKRVERGRNRELGGGLTRYSGRPAKGNIGVEVAVRAASGSVWRRRNDGADDDSNDNINVSPQARCFDRRSVFHAEYSHIQTQIYIQGRVLSCLAILTGMDYSDCVYVCLRRDNSSQPWGFRLMGGYDQGQYLYVAKVRVV